MDQFEWDPAKNAANLLKHGISFEEAMTIWEGPVVSNQDNTHHSEMREISFGLIGATTVLCVVHTDRNGKIRIISARKATKNERKQFDAYLKNALN
jgi:uncharacterized DUF497 family protein